MDKFHSPLNLLLLFSFSLLHVSNFSSVSVYALNIGNQAKEDYDKNCSRICESKFCAIAPILRYGKYCGLKYGGCPGEQPCDGLDSCCMNHDNCVGSKGYLSEECSQTLLNCVNNFKSSGEAPFNGNTCKIEEVIGVISAAMKAGEAVGELDPKQHNSAPPSL